MKKDLHSISNEVFENAYSLVVYGKALNKEENENKLFLMLEKAKKKTRNSFLSPFLHIKKGISSTFNKYTFYYLVLVVVMFLLLYFIIVNKESIPEKIFSYLGNIVVYGVFLCTLFLGLFSLVPNYLDTKIDSHIKKISKILNEKGININQLKLVALNIEVIKKQFIRRKIFIQSFFVLIWGTIFLFLKGIGVFNFAILENLEKLELERVNNIYLVIKIAIIILSYILYLVVALIIRGYIKTYHYVFEVCSYSVNQSIFREEEKVAEEKNKTIRNHSLY